MVRLPCIGPELADANDIVLEERSSISEQVIQERLLNAYFDGLAPHGHVEADPTDMLGELCLVSGHVKAKHPSEDD